MSEADFIPLEDPGTSKRETKGSSKAASVNATLFVSSLPYNATSTDLVTHFSFVGPIRHGFVATDKESGKSKGVGYVTYALAEDAERALNELDASEFGDKGRKIRVAWANKKPLQEVARTPQKARPSITENPESKSDASAPSVASVAATDPNAIRTLILSGLPADLTKAVLWKKVRKTNDSAEVIYPIEDEANTAHIVFPSHGDALRALPKLHGHTYKGVLLSCVLKKRLEKLSAKGEGRAPSHAGRLIVRNLAWDTTEQDLRATFLRYGPIQAIDLPTLPSKLTADPDKPPPPPRARGFAFVWFVVKKDAERAMEAVNGKPIIKAASIGKGKGKSVEEGRPVAVDWALSKEKWNQTQGKNEDEPVSSDSKSDSDEASEDDSDNSKNDDKGIVDDEAEEDEDINDDSDVEMNVEDQDEEVAVKPKLPDTDVGSTLFIRNLPYEATEQELGTLFRTFGPIRYARITMDHSTGRSRGTGFVCYWNSEHADEAIIEAERVAQETGANAQPLGEKKNPFALPSVLTADPSSSLASRLVLHGRTLGVSRAVTREQAGNLKEDAERAREKGDKRNTYLMREGVIFPNSPAAANLPETEVEKRQAAFNARKALLRSNPSLYISKTRLSVRQLPLFVTDRTLKRLAIHAVRTFDAGVKEGICEPLSRTEEADDTLSPAVEARTGKPKRGERQTAVVQSKVVRQTEKIDPLTGAGRSKGYGFLELRSHKDALKVLRWANNNPAVGPLVWEWWRGELAEVRERTRAQLERARGATTNPGGEAPKESVEELESRLKKLDARVEEGDERSGGGMRGGKTLLIEFSIENVQVVRRRVDKMTGGTRGSGTREPGVRGSSATSGDSRLKRKTDAVPAEDTDDEDGPVSKRARGKADSAPRDRSKSKSNRSSKPSGKPDATVRSSSARGDIHSKETDPRGLEKLGSHLGSMIGRKRKLRRTK